MDKKHMLVLGATGPTGLLFCEAALQAGHKLTLFVRNPSKVPEKIAQDENVNIIEGELTQEDRLKAAATSGASVLVSFLGPGTGHKGTPLADGYKSLIPLIIQEHFERALLLATPSWTAPGEGKPLKWSFMIGMVRLFLGDAYRDINAIGDYANSLSVDEIKWTVFRVPMLSNAAPAEVHAGYMDSAGTYLSRSSMVRWVIQEVDEAKWVGKAPILWNCRWQ